MLKGKSAWKIFALLTALILFYSCASSPKKEILEGTEDPYIPDTSEAISIPIPKKTSHSYFSSIKNNVMALVEDGSIESLKDAASALHKSGTDEYEENEKVLLYVCAEIMKIVWPSQTVTWEVPEVTSSTPYTGALDSVKKGIYDSSTGNIDFLTLVLPSLVLLTSSQKKDYYGESNAALTTALEMRENSVLANYLMGILKQKQGKYEEALQYYNKASSFASPCSEILYAKANAYKLIGKNEIALELAETIVEQYPQDVKILELCAESSYALGSYTKAEQYIVRVLQLAPENSEYLLFRAHLLILKGDYIKASSLLDAYSRSNTSSRNYLLLRAKLQRDWNKNTTASSETIQKALELYPGDKDILLFSAQLCSSASITIKGNNALYYANQVLEKDNNNIDAQIICVNEFKKKHEWQSAYDLSSKLISQKNCPSSLNFAHIDICLALGKTEEASGLASKLYYNSPSDENAQQLYIKVLVSLNKKNDCVQLIETLMPKASSKMKSFLLYERSFFQTDSDSVLSDLRSSLTSNPRNNDSLYRLYEIYYNKKDYRKALYYLNQVIALNPTDSYMQKKKSDLESLIK